MQDCIPPLSIASLRVTLHASACTSDPNLLPESTTITCKYCQTWCHAPTGNRSSARSRLGSCQKDRLALLLCGTLLKEVCPMRTEERPCHSPQYVTLTNVVCALHNGHHPSDRDITLNKNMEHHASPSLTLRVVNRSIAILFATLLAIILASLIILMLIAIAIVIVILILILNT